MAWVNVHDNTLDVLLHVISIEKEKAILVRYNPRGRNYIAEIHKMFEEVELPWWKEFGTKDQAMQFVSEIMAGV